MRTWSVTSCAFLVAAASGCSTIEYKADSEVVKRLGAAEAKTKLKALAMGAAATGGGVVTSVDVTDESLKVKSQQTTLGLFYVPETRQLENEVYFRAVDRVDLYSNKWAYVYASGGRLVLQVLFKTLEETKSFADLVLSFKAQQGG